MRVLVFGPSGSGKTYIASALRQKGIAAFDADKLKGLSAWYNKDGLKVPDPTSAEDAINNQYSFAWSKRYLITFLNRFPDVYIFGASGNVFKMFELFDKVYFLKVDTETQKKRLAGSPNRNPNLDFKQNELIIWGQWLEQAAREHDIPFLDGTLHPSEIYSIISQCQ